MKNFKPPSGSEYLLNFSILIVSTISAYLYSLKSDLFSWGDSTIDGLYLLFDVYLLMSLTLILGAISLYRRQVSFNLISFGLCILAFIVMNFEYFFIATLASICSSLWIISVFIYNLKADSVK